LQDISSAVDAPDGPYEDAPEFTRSGSHMFFTSGHDGFGRELWALPVSALLTPAPQQTATPTPPRSNSGGGCALDPTASSGWIALLVAAVLLVLRKAA
jgi:hypothetical protein